MLLLKIFVLLTRCQIILHLAELAEERLGQASQDTLAGCTLRLLLEQGHPRRDTLIGTVGCCAHFLEVSFRLASWCSLDIFMELQASSGFIILPKVNHTPKLSLATVEELLIW